jgi:hypothetical protein
MVDATSVPSKTSHHCSLYVLKREGRVETSERQLKEWILALNVNLVVLCG